MEGMCGIQMVIIRKRGLGIRKQRNGGEVMKNWVAGTGLRAALHKRSLTSSQTIKNYWLL